VDRSRRLSNSASQSMPRPSDDHHNIVVEWSCRYSVCRNLTIQRRHGSSRLDACIRFVAAAGLSLSSAGSIFGTPTSAGTSGFTVVATDSGNPQQTASQQLSMVINTAPLRLLRHRCPAV